MKLTKRKGFNFFRSYYDVYNELDNESKVKFIDALLDRQFLGVKPDKLDGMAKFAYISQTNSIDSQVKGYEDKTNTKLSDPPTVGVKEKEITPTLQVQEKVQVQVQVQEEGKGKEIKVYSSEINECFDNCLNYFPPHLHPKDNKQWIETIDKLNRIDNIPFSVIEDVVRKTRNDEFWSAQFLSLTKLRKTNKEGIKYIIVFNEKFKSNKDEKRNKLNEVTNKIRRGNKDI